MADDSFAERKRILNKHSNIPQSCLVEDMVITQPTKKETLLAQIDPGEWTPCIFGHPSVEEYIFRKQYKEANDLDHIRLGEYQIHVYDNMRKSFGKWTEEGPDGTGVLKVEQPVEARIMGNCAVCNRLQHQMGL